MARILVDLQRDETMVRRSLIMKNIKATFRDILKNTAWDEELFGKGLAEKLKAAKVLQQSSKDLKNAAKGHSDFRTQKTCEARLAGTDRSCTAKGKLAGRKDLTINIGIISRLIRIATLFGNGSRHQKRRTRCKYGRW